MPVHGRLKVAVERRVQHQMHVRAVAPLVLQQPHVHVVRPAGAQGVAPWDADHVEVARPIIQAARRRGQSQRRRRQRRRARGALRLLAEESNDLLRGRQALGRQHRQGALRGRQALGRQHRQGALHALLC